MKPHSDRKFHKNFNTYEEYCKDYERRVKEFEDEERIKQSPLKAVLDGTLLGTSLGLQIFALKKTFEKAYEVISQLNLGKKKTENLKNKKCNAEDISQSVNSDENRLNPECLTQSLKTSPSLESESTLKIAEVFDSKITNISYDYLKNGLKKALMEARHESNLDGSDKKSKINLNEIMELLKSEIKKSSFKLKEDQKVAINLLKEKLEAFITQIDPNFNAKELTEKLLLSTNWSNFESKDCLKKAATFLQNEIDQKQMAQKINLTRPSYVFKAKSGNETDFQYEYYQNNQTQCFNHSYGKFENAISTHEFKSEEEHEQKFQSKNLILEESNNSNSQKYQLTHFAREALNRNFGDALNGLLADPAIEEILNDSQSSCKSFEEVSKQNFETFKTATNESSKFFVFDNFNPYDPFDPYH